MNRFGSEISMGQKRKGAIGTKPNATLEVTRDVAGSRRLCPVFETLKKEGPRYGNENGDKGNIDQREVIPKVKANSDASGKASQDLETSVLTKTTKKTKVANPASLTPTVILNGLAMARGEEVQYRVVNKTPLPSQPIYFDEYKMDRLDWMRMYYYGYDHPGENYFRKPVKRWIYPYLFHVEAKVGDRAFVGEGKSQQAARHNAAQRALEVLESMPIPKQEKKTIAAKKKEKVVAKTADTESTIKQNLSKSPISVLYEKASGCRLKVDFTVTSEEGPPHLKMFTMKATVFKPSSEVIISVEGRGNNKNAAKTKAATNALEKLNEMSLPVHVKNTSTRKPRATDAKIAAIVTSNTTLHPCSRLSQILQAKKEKLPAYSLVSSVENHLETKFVIQCSAMEQTSTGEGKSKKEAKRAASENMLKKMDYFPQNQSNTVAAKVDMKNTPLTSKNKNSTEQKFKRNKSTGPGGLPTLLEV